MALDVETLLQKQGVWGKKIECRDSTQYLQYVFCWSIQSCWSRSQCAPNTVSKKRWSLLLLPRLHDSCTFYVYDDISTKGRQGETDTDIFAVIVALAVHWDTILH